MRKKITYAGLALIAVAVALFFILQSFAGSFVVNSIGKSVTTSNLTVPAGNFSYVPVSVGGNSSLLIIYAVSLRPINYYVFNSTGFSSFASYMGSNQSSGGLGFIQSHQASLLAENANSSEVILTKNLNGTSPNQTVRNLTAFNPGGTVYMVLDNSNGSLSSASPVVGKVEYFKPSASQLSSFGSASWNFALEGSAVLLLGIAGIALLIYGIVKKGPGEKAAAAPAKGKDEGTSKEYIDALYKDVGKKGRGK